MLSPFYRWIIEAKGDGFPEITQQVHGRAQTGIQDFFFAWNEEPDLAIRVFSHDLGGREINILWQREANETFTEASRISWCPFWLGANSLRKLTCS